MAESKPFLGVGQYWAFLSSYLWSLLDQLFPNSLGQARPVLLQHFPTLCSIDATTETGRLGRLVNHSRLSPNLQTKVVVFREKPRLILIARRDIEPGEELLYDYGDRSKESLEAHPWLALWSKPIDSSVQFILLAANSLPLSGRLLETYTGPMLVSRGHCPHFCDS